MQYNDKKEVLINFATERLEYFEKCLLIGFNFNEIIKITIINFLLQLKEELRKSLANEDGWEFCGNPTYGDMLENPLTIFSGLFITKNNWGKKFLIGISADKSMARDIIIGIYRGGEVKAKKVANGKLIDLLNTKFKPGYHSDYWEWWSYLDNNYRNWYNEEVLIKIYKKDDLVELIKKQIIAIKNIATPIIDKVYN